MKYYDHGSFMILAANHDAGIIKGFEQYSGSMVHPVWRTRIFEMQQGRLRLFAGFTWNGLSGPTPNDPLETKEASAVHDALYPLIHWILRFPIDSPEWQKLRRCADKEFLRLCIKNDAAKVKRKMYYRAVRWRGDEHMQNMKNPYQIVEVS